MALNQNSRSAGRHRSIHDYMREPKSSGPTAKIIIHGEGAGAPSTDAVVQRARELAIIAGRAPGNYTDDDYRQAKLELLQQPEPDDEDMEESSLPFEPGSGEVLGGRESEAPSFGDNDENFAEELVREGMDEALHDEMLEARKKEIREG